MGASIEGHRALALLRLELDAASREKEEKQRGSAVRQYDDVAALDPRRKRGDVNAHGDLVLGDPLIQARVPAVSYGMSRIVRDVPYRTGCPVSHGMSRIVRDVDYLARGLLSVQRALHCSGARSGRHALQRNALQRHALGGNDASA